MLDRRKVIKQALAELYEQRWNVELDFRNIKTTLGLEVLSCKTPQMSEKELCVYLLAHNLIRLLMAQAALHAGVHPRPRGETSNSLLDVLAEWNAYLERHGQQSSVVGQACLMASIA